MASSFLSLLLDTPTLANVALVIDAELEEQARKVESSGTAAFDGWDASEALDAVRSAGSIKPAEAEAILSTIDRLSDDQVATLLHSLQKRPAT